MFGERRVPVDAGVTDTPASASAVMPEAGQGAG